MYVIAKAIDNNTFKMVYAVFKDKERATVYTKKYRLDTVVIEADFPFFLIEEFSNEENYYQYITKDELERKIEQTKTLDHSKFGYFNLWRIDGDTYNKNFPDEPILNGMDFHIHFTDSDIKEIEKNGFDVYWKDITTI